MGRFAEACEVLSVAHGVEHGVVVGDFLAGLDLARAHQRDRAALLADHRVGLAAVVHEGAEVQELPALALVDRVGHHLHELVLLPHFHHQNGVLPDQEGPVCADDLALLEISVGSQFPITLSFANLNSLRNFQVLNEDYFGIIFEPSFHNIWINNMKQSYLIDQTQIFESPNRLITFIRPTQTLKLMPITFIIKLQISTQNFIPNIDIFHCNMLII